MSRRWRYALGGWLVLVALLSQPVGAGRPPGLLDAPAVPTSGTPSPGPDGRARAVPPLAAERDRLRAAQAARVPDRGTPPAAPAVASGGAIPADRFGFGVADVTTGRGSTLELAARAGAGWLLGWVSWQNVEPARGAFAWQAGAPNDLDNVAEGGRAYGLKVLVRLQSPPPWATSDGSGRLSQVDPDDLRRSMEAIARRGAGRVAAYQVFNEPNLTYEWGAEVVDAPAAARYARLLAAAYRGLKSGDPRAVVVSAGMANGATAPSMSDLDYLRAFYAAGAKGSFDALGTHPYGGDAAPESTTCGGTCFRRAERQREIMVEYGDGGTPMWATEVGWLHESDYDLGPYFDWQKVTAQEQADYLVRAFRFAEQHWPWMGPMFVFNHDHSTAMWCGGPCYPPTTSVHWFSVLNPDRSARPAYTALAAMPKSPASPPSRPPATPTRATAVRTATPTRTPVPLPPRLQPSPVRSATPTLPGRRAP